MIIGGYDVEITALGSDDGTWGNILNDFLAMSHNTVGSLKPISQSLITNLQTALADLQTAIDNVQTTVDNASGSSVF